MSDTADVSRTQAWVMAARPQTLPAGAAPVVVGVGLAVHDGVFALLPAVAALLGALLIQVGTNFANDYYDAIRGADTDEREGFTRVTQSGLIPAERVRKAMYAAFGLAVAVGLYLVAVGGLPILVVGLLSIAAGIAYTGGPYPFGYYGLGDLFVFVFFGLVAVTGTYYVQAAATMASVGLFPLSVPPGTVPLTAIAASLPAAALSTNILVVNNIRDLETDRAAGKETLAVKIGYRWSRVEFAVMLVLAYVVPPGFAALWRTPYPLVALVTAPLAWKLWGTVSEHTSGEKLNPALERAGQLLFAFSVLFALGLAAPTAL